MIDNEDENDIFPAWAYPSADWRDPIQVIASKLGVPEHAVELAFCGLEVPDWSDPKHLNWVQSEVSALNRARQHTERLIEYLGDLSESSRQGLALSGSPTRHQLMLLVKELSGQREYLVRFTNEHSLKGGRNPAAYIVAEGTRRLFRRQRRKISWGQVEGFPSIDFGRAVQSGLDAFGILASWRGPTEMAYRKQAAFEERLNQMKRSK